MPKSVQFDLKFFQCTASSFLTAAAPIIQEIPEEPRLAEEHFSQFTPEAISRILFAATNISLAIELYLKTILVYRKRKFPNSHDLGKLFEALSEEDRTAIEQRFSKELARFPNVAYFDLYATKSETARGFGRDLTSGMTVSEVLADTGDSYIHWRYLAIDTFQRGFSKTLRFHYRQLYIIANILDHSLLSAVSSRFANKQRAPRACWHAPSFRLNPSLTIPRHPVPQAASPRA